MKQRIIIVEDENFMASMMTSVLEKAGFSVEVATDGEEGLQKIEKTLPDLILLDLVLPGINGFELLEKLKKEKRTEKIPVIIVSNLGTPEDIQKGLKTGANAFLIKTHILPKDLVDKVKKVLQQKNKGRISNNNLKFQI